MRADRPARLRTSRDNLIHNCRQARALAPDSSLMAVIKADAYGYGADLCARDLLGEVDAFAVATIDEALELRGYFAREDANDAEEEASSDDEDDDEDFADDADREADDEYFDDGEDREADAEDADEDSDDPLNGKPITVLHGVHSLEALVLAVKENLTLVIHDMAQIKLLERPRMPGQLEILLEKTENSAAAPRLWLKINTGMNRLGINPDQASSCLERLEHIPWLPWPIGLMTHLACADEAEDDATAEQLRRLADIPGAGPRSAANSAAVLRYPESHLDWIRPGLMLYGVAPANCLPAGIRPVMTFEAPLLMVRDCKAGDRLGYGGDYACPSDMRVGLIEAGYADGYPRASNGRTEVAIGGRRCPTLGRVSMDLIAVDLSGHPAAEPGDWAELWGEQIPVEEVAEKSGTIAYELLTRVHRRVVRERR